LIDARGLAAIIKLAALHPAFALSRAKKGYPMAPQTLQGRSILIVEDEPLIVMDITQALEGAGASVTTTNTLKHALLLVEHDGLSAAILDHSLGNDKSTLLTNVSNNAESPS
jgi:ActR/RegA family two-component response regulator